MGKNSTFDQRREDESDERGGFSSVPFTPAPKPTQEELRKAQEEFRKAQEELRKARKAANRQKNIILHLETQLLIARERGVSVALITRDEVIQRRIDDIENEEMLQAERIEKQRNNIKKEERAWKKKNKKKKKKPLKNKFKLRKK